MIQSPCYRMTSKELIVIYISLEFKEFVDRQTVSVIDARLQVHNMGKEVLPLRCGGYKEIIHKPRASAVAIHNLLLRMPFRSKLVTLHCFQKATRNLDQIENLVQPQKPVSLFVHLMYIILSFSF